jgi:hypothetical protein
MNLSKREVFAAFAMNALLGDDWNVGDRNMQNRSIPALIELAYKIADEMQRQSVSHTSSK